MAFTLSQIEEISTWCATQPSLAPIRQDARKVYFAEDDPRPVHYWPGAGDATGRNRRFLGWFLFSFRLPTGERPAELAVESLYRGAARAEALQAVQPARYVFALVASVVWGRGVVLELEDERFEVRHAAWSRLLRPERAVVAHLLPVRGQRQWLPGPGWVEWPLLVGPHMRQHLARFQVDPLTVERLLQSRQDPEAREPAEELPQDATLAEAVARMTAAAEAAGRGGLVLSAEQWTELVLRHLLANQAAAFAQEVIRRVGSVDDAAALNRWLGLAMNIWNTVPQPDRGGRTARDLFGGGEGQGADDVGAAR